MPLTFVIATIITVLMNADSVAIGKYLYQNKDISKELASQAVSTINTYNDRIAELKAGRDTATLQNAEDLRILGQKVTQLRGDIGYLKDSVTVVLPLGWKDGKIDLGLTGKHFIGWLASILAICLGAPFWFDLLNKIANIRNAGARPPTNQKE